MHSNPACPTLLALRADARAAQRQDDADAHPAAAVDALPPRRARDARAPLVASGAARRRRCHARRAQARAAAAGV
eukprot:293149-Chlamydomonas_euryale.AAC.1